MLALINTTMGATLIIAPVLAIKTGYIFSLIILALIALLCYYTAWALVIHQSNCPTISQMIEAHFVNNTYIWLKMY